MTIMYLYLMAISAFVLGYMTHVVVIYIGKRVSRYLQYRAYVKMIKDLDRG